MKVTVIGYCPTSGIYSYGSVSTWAKNAWEQLGHEVVMYDRSEIKNLPKKSDLYFFVDVSEDYSTSMPDDLEGVKVFWAMDTAMPGGMERSVNIGRKVDYVFCTNAETNGPKAFEKFGIEAMWVPYGYDHKLRDLVKEAKRWNVNIATGQGSQHYRYDVCMIGNPNSEQRKELWNLLKDKYGDRAVTGTIDNVEEYIEKKAGSKIMISQPTEPFNTIINLRVFNALSCGKFLLCKRPIIKEHELLGLKDGVNVVYWDNFDDLLEKIDYYLEHGEEREKIAEEGAKLGCKYLMPDQIRIIEQIIYSKFYERLC